MTSRVSVVEDLDKLQHWEYWLQLSVGTPDLHVRKGWSLCNDDHIEQFEHFSGVLDGPIVYCWLECTRLPSYISVETILGGELNVVWPEIGLPSGFIPLDPSAPSSTAPKYFLLCFIAAGRSLARPLNEIPKYFPSQIPEHYSSTVFFETSETHSRFRQIYNVKRSEQVLSVALVEIQMVRLSIHVSAPLCEMCEEKPASLFCAADRAHLCSACDTVHHANVEGNELLARHKRVPVAETPFQFGLCAYHPSESIESVCVSCWTPLCALCQLVGRHAGPKFIDHTVISTIDAFALAMRSASPADVKNQERMDKLVAYQKARQLDVSTVHSTFDRLASRLDQMCRSLISKIRATHAKRIRYIQAARRELLAGALALEWHQIFFKHARLTLPPAEFIQAARSHTNLVKYILNNTLPTVLMPSKTSDNLGLSMGSTDIRTRLPLWVVQKTFVDGALRVISSRKRDEEKAAATKTSSLPRPFVEALIAADRTRGAMGRSPLFPSNLSAAEGEGPGGTANWRIRNNALFDDNSSAHIPGSEVFDGRGPGGADESNRSRLGVRSHAERMQRSMADEAHVGRQSTVREIFGAKAGGELWAQDDELDGRGRDADFEVSYSRHAGVSSLQPDNSARAGLLQNSNLASVLEAVPTTATAYSADLQNPRSLQAGQREERPELLARSTANAKVGLAALHKSSNLSQQGSQVSSSSVRPPPSTAALVGALGNPAVKKGPPPIPKKTTISKEPAGIFKVPPPPVKNQSPPVSAPRSLTPTKSPPKAPPSQPRNTTPPKANPPPPNGPPKSATLFKNAPSTNTTRPVTPLKSVAGTPVSPPQNNPLSSVPVVVIKKPPPPIPPK